MTIQPFTVHIPQPALDNLRYRLAQAEWPTEIPDAGWSRGVPLGYMRELAEYWRTGFDWRAQEDKLNAFPHYTTEIDGQTIHFLHARSPEANALPLLILHGYPSSFVEFMHLIGPLVDPRAYGGDPAGAFHVVVPSLPGYGFSTPVREAGWELSRTSRAMAELMRRLGYDRYVAQGGDIGAGVIGSLGSIDADHLIGTHISTDPTALALLGAPIVDPTGDPSLTEGEKERLLALRELQAEGKGYLEIQSTKPQTLAYALVDSPVGQLAWIVEKFQAWTNVDATLPDEAVDRDHLLTNISLYYFTRTGGSAANFIYEATHSSAPWAAESNTPTAFAAFNVRHLEKAMRQMVDPEQTAAQWTNFEQGGHFPAMEAPDLLMNDMRQFFRRFR